MIDQGSSELNVIVGVAEHDLHQAIRSIYEVFITSKMDLALIKSDIIS